MKSVMYIYIYIYIYIVSYKPGKSSLSGIKTTFANSCIDTFSIIESFGSPNIDLLIILSKYKVVICNYFICDFTYKK